MMPAHEERKHSLLSPSNLHRTLVCTPSARLEENVPDTGSTYAAEGTLAHELCELKLRHYFQTTTMTKRKYAAGVRALQKKELWADEMETHTDAYLDYIKSIALAQPFAPYVAIEAKVDLGAYIEGAYGTVDCLLIYGNTLHVIDFKYGKGVPVEAENNFQMMAYALGALDASAMFWDIQTIRMTIVQPRLGSISEASMPVHQIRAFGNFVKERAKLALAGEGEFAPGEKTCRFCKVRATCRARADRNVQLAFAAGRKPPQITAAEVGDYLVKGAAVAAWLEDLKAWALAEALAGRQVPGWKAVEGRGSRAWTNQEEAFTVLQASGVPRADLYEEKPLTLAAIEKMMGRKAFDAAVGRMVIKSPGKPTLVPEDDKREAIKIITAADAFGGERG